MQLYLKKQLLIVSCLYIGQMACGYSLGWPSNVVIKLMDPEQTPLPEPMTETQSAWVGSLTFIGVMFSSVAAYLSNARGRKPCFILGGIIFIASYLILALANSLAMVYAGRTTKGISSGIIFTMNLVYIAEIASSNIRGILLTGTGVSYTFGILLAYSVGPFVSYAATGYVGVILSMVFTAGSFLLPETPTYYILKGQENKARDALVALGRIDDVDNILGTKEYRPIGIKQAFREIFTVKSNRKAMFITAILMCLQHLSGIAVILMFATTIFNLTVSSLEAHISTIIIGVTQFVASFITPVFIERCGRRVLLLVSTSACCICLALLGVYFYLEHIDHASTNQIHWLPVVSLVIFISSYNFGLGIIPGTLTGEMFDSNVRGPGSVFIFNVAWLVGFVVSTTFGYMLAALGAHVIFWMYSGVCVFATLFAAIFVPETKGKSLGEIQEILSK